MSQTHAHSDRRERGVAGAVASYDPSESMRALPILLLFGAMFYWLWRAGGHRMLPMLVRLDSTAVATRAK